LTLLSPKEVAAMLCVSERTLRRLKLPRVKFGKQYKYRPTDVEAYINLHLEYPAVGEAHHVSRVQKKSQQVGLQILPSREMLHAIRLGNKNGGQGGGTGSAN
jgi:excisionase family DNA binding protein